MKSPDQLRRKLGRQWQQASLRQERLLNADSWPVQLTIGHPSTRQFTAEPTAVQKHRAHWQQVRVGKVHWHKVSYRTGATAIEVPDYWELRTPSEWVAATADPTIKQEFDQLEQFVATIDQRFWALLIRRRALWRDKPTQTVIEAAQLACALSPGCARGKPLRLLADYAIDTKFFEHHERLITTLLDQRFDGTVSEQGLANFLDARQEKEHWLLLAPLDRGLLPFSRQRVTAAEIERTPLTARQILIIENEHCLHLLPLLPDTVAILGAGLNLSWLQAHWLKEKKIAYWGDMDSWGLLMLARARQHLPRLTALLMNQTLFDRYAPSNAVTEPVLAQETVPDGLTEKEQQLYRHLLTQSRGRLEQEYLPQAEVEQALNQWQNKTSD